MRTYHLFSETQIKTWMEEIAAFHEELISLKIPFSKEHLYTEEEVSEILGVTVRTVRTYRKKHYLRYIKFKGRIYFLKVLLYVDLILFCERSLEEG